MHRQGYLQGVRMASRLFGPLRSFLRTALLWAHSVSIALLHILREQAPVFLALLDRLLVRCRHRFLQLIGWVQARKLRLALYCLLLALVVKASGLLLALFVGWSFPFWFTLLDDGLLVGACLVFFALLGRFIAALLQMEQQDDGDVVQFSGEIGALLSLRCAIEHSPEALALWDKNGAMVLSNAKFREIFECAPALEPKGQVLNYEQFTGQVQKLMMRPLMRPRRGGKRFQPAAYEAQLRDGRWVQFQEQPTVDGGLFCLSFDMTALKSVQQNLTIREEQMRSTVKDLRLSRRELEQKTQKLAELAENLMQEKNRALEANRVKTEFLANMSHELRTPLNAILGFSDLIQREVLGPVANEKYKSYVADIHASGAFLLELINDILDMSKIETGRFKLDRKTCALPPLLQESVKLMSSLALEKNIQLRSSFPSSLICPVDGRALKQVLLNLLSNAIKFTAEGGDVVITAEQHLNEVVITVRDTGIGIAADQIDRLGRPFVQIENQMTKSYSGTGLGLAISRRLIDLHGGELSIASEVDVGTTVKITLPISPPALGHDKSPHRSLAA